MTIPARHIISVHTQHLMRAIDDVFEDFIQRRAHMNVAIGIGRPVMERILRLSLTLLTQALIEPNFSPPREPFRFFLRQASPHREIGFGKEKRVAVIGHVYLGKGC